MNSVRKFDEGDTDEKASRAGNTTSCRIFRRKRPADLKSLKPAVPLQVCGGSFPQKESSLPGIEKGGRLFQGPGCMVLSIDQIYWTKNVALEGADRLPAPSTAISVIVLSPVWVT